MDLKTVCTVRFVLLLTKQCSVSYTNGKSPIVSGHRRTTQTAKLQFSSLVGKGRLHLCAFDAAALHMALKRDQQIDRFDLNVKQFH